MQINREGQRYIITDFEDSELQAAKKSPSNIEMLHVKDGVAFIGYFKTEHLASLAENRIKDEMSSEKTNGTIYKNSVNGSKSHRFTTSS